MRIKSIKLNPFAATQDRTFSFKNGFNILLGPNEAGKSTLFQAVSHGLFTSTNKTASRLGTEMGDFFPAGGGDVIRLEISLKHDDGSVSKVLKVWKKGNRQGSASLTLPDGTEITDEDEVQKKIEEMLPVSAASMRTILLSDQSGLQETLKRMEKEQEVRNELGTALRKTVMETAGVSIDRFRKILDERYDSYFKKWDRDQKYPENNKGIQNPYKSGFGKVLEAFYAKERCKIDYEHALEYEKRVDELNKEITRLTAGIQEKKKEQQKLNPLKEGIRKRQGKESDIKGIDYELKDIHEINKTWPVYEDRLQNIDNEIAKLDKQIEKFDQEWETAQKQQGLKLLRDRVEKLNRLRKDFNYAKREAEKVVKVTEDQIKELKDVKSDIDKLEAQVNAARLSVTIEAKSDTTFDLREAGKDAPEKVKLNSDDEREFKIRGGFAIETDSLKLNVFSGEGDIESIVEKLDREKESFGKLLQIIPVENLREAESLAKKYDDKQVEMKQAQKLYSEELGNDDHEELKKRLEETSSDKQIREHSEISNDLVNAKTNKSDIEKEKKDKNEKLLKWKEKYGEHDKVAGKLGELMHKQTTLKEEIDNLPELPDEFESADLFFKYIDELDRDIHELNEKLSEIKLEKAKEEGKDPGSSSEELYTQLKEAEEEFERVNSEADTLARVREKATELLESLDRDTYRGLEESFLNWLSRITGERFSMVNMQQDMPGSFVTDQQRELTYRMLSHGTKGAVALAWRFALCDHLLDNKPAVIALDDPLVDMDPKRRLQAVEAIHEFSKKHQVLIMTCHPDHAEEMEKGDGANLIEV